MKNEVLYIAALRKTQRIADWLDQLETARAKVAKGIGVSIYQNEIDAIAPALEAAGIPDDAQIEVAPKPAARDNAEGRRAAYAGHTYLSEIEAQGDINNLLRRFGNSAAAE